MRTFHITYSLRDESKSVFLDACTSNAAIARIIGSLNRRERLFFHIIQVRMVA